MKLCFASYTINNVSVSNLTLETITDTRMHSLQGISYRTQDISISRTCFSAAEHENTTMERGNVFFLLFFSFLAFSMSFLAAAPVVSTSPVTGYIVAVVWPKVEQPEHFAIRTLTRVLGSEAAARKALMYVYYHALSGFAAKLTNPEQVAALKRQPGVLQVIPNRLLHLDGPVKHPRAEIIS